jgi:hypothetical protein
MSSTFLRKDWINKVNPLTEATLKAVAESAAERLKGKLPFDINVAKKVKQIQQVTVQVPYVVKKGLFRKETVLKPETQQYEIWTEEMLQGWKLDYFYRKTCDISSSSMKVIDIDEWVFFLGEDGVIYYYWKSTDGDTQILEEVLFAGIGSGSENGLKNIFCGLIGALDMVPVDGGNIQKIPDPPDLYEFNFPTESDLVTDFTIGFLNRVDNLISRTNK